MWSYYKNNFITKKVKELALTFLFKDLDRIIKLI